MKIGDPIEKPSGITPLNGQAAIDNARTAGAAPAAAVAANAAPDASIQVQLSSGATSLLATASNAEFDADKVARIASQIAAGTFKVNADVIADKLISNAQELLTQARH